MTTIPPITDPLGRYWEQPDVKDILVDDIHAVMTKETMEKLKDYSHTNPSGVYEGKMWRGRVMLHIGNNRWIFTDEWWLHWYGTSDDPKKCSFNTRTILLI